MDSFIHGSSSNRVSPNSSTSTPHHQQISCIYSQQLKEPNRQTMLPTNQNERKSQHIDNVAIEKSAKGGMDEGGILQALEFSQQDLKECAAGKHGNALKSMSTEHGNALKSMAAESPATLKAAKGVGEGGSILQALEHGNALTLLENKESPVTLKSEKAMDEGGIQQALEFSRQGHEEYAAGKHANALKLMNESLTIVERELPDSPEVAVVLSSIGIMCQEAGIDNGFQYHWRALRIRLRDQPNTAFEAESQEHVGMSLLSEHHSDAALRHLTKALSFHESKNPSSFLTAIQHIHVGQAQENVGQLQEAIRSFERALLIFSGLKLDSLDAANAHCLLGRVLREQGNFEAAKEQLAQAIAMYEAKAPASLDLANAYVELGRVHGLAQGCPNTGMAFFAKALEIQNAVAPNSLEVANTFHHVAASHASVGNSETGQLYLLGAKSIRESLASSKDSTEPEVVGNEVSLL
jgi:tetratricopeptide (TPR) repeat protein